MRLGTTLPSPYPVTQKCQCNYTFHKYVKLTVIVTHYIFFTHYIVVSWYL